MAHEVGFDCDLPVPIFQTSRRHTAISSFFFSSFYGTITQLGFSEVMGYYRRSQKTHTQIFIRGIRLSGEHDKKHSQSNAFPMCWTVTSEALGSCLRSRASGRIPPIALSLSLFFFFLSLSLSFFLSLSGHTQSFLHDLAGPVATLEKIHKFSVLLFCKSPRNSSTQP